MPVATSQGKVDSSADRLDRDTGVPSRQPLACAAPPTEPCFSPRLELALHDPGVRASPSHLPRVGRIEPPGMPASCAPLTNMRLRMLLPARPAGRLLPGSRAAAAAAEQAACFSCAVFSPPPPQLPHASPARVSRPETQDKGLLGRHRWGGRERVCVCGTPLKVRHGCT